MKEPIEIVLTGGPSSGKTSSLTYLQEKLSEWGYLVLVTPEIATSVFASGVPNPETLSVHQRDAYVGVEQTIMYLQLDMREHYLKLASLFPEKDVIILYDRAEPDCKAYLSDEEMAKCLKDRNIKYSDMRDKYDVVIHLRSVALAEGLEYDKDSNPQRREDRQMAIDADHRTLNAWLGHPMLHIIDAGQDFDSKKKATLAAISESLGRKKQLVLGHERRFLVEGDFQTFLPRVHQHYHITQNYLRGASLGQWSVLTRRETLGEKSSTVTYYRGDASGDPLGKEPMVRGRIISRDDYERMLRAEAAASRKPLVKERFTFSIGKKIDVELDKYDNGTGIITANFKASKAEAPAWFGPEVTNNPDFSTVALALKNHTKG